MNLSASDSAAMNSGFHFFTVLRKAGGLLGDFTISYSNIGMGLVEDERSFGLFQHTLLLLFPSPPCTEVHC